MLFRSAAWRPDIAFVQRINNPEVERSLLDSVPAVYVAHDYLGLCISGARSHRARGDRVCHERFDAGCLVRFFPCGCGGRSPLTMWRDFQRQSAVLDRLRGYHSVVCFSDQMRHRFLQQGFAEDRVHVVPLLEEIGRAHV